MVVKYLDEPQDEEGIWHLLNPQEEHKTLCGENKANTIATDDIRIVQCQECLERYKLKGKRARG